MGRHGHQRGAESSDGLLEIDLLVRNDRHPHLVQSLPHSEVRFLRRQQEEGNAMRCGRKKNTWRHGRLPSDRGSRTHGRRPSDGLPEDSSGQEKHRRSTGEAHVKYTPPSLTSSSWPGVKTNLCPLQRHRQQRHRQRACHALACWSGTAALGRGCARAGPGLPAAAPYKAAAAS